MCHLFLLLLFYESQQPQGKFLIPSVHFNLDANIQVVHEFKTFVIRGAGCLLLDRV